MLTIAGAAAVLAAALLWWKEKRDQRAHAAWCEAAAKADGVVSRVGIRGYLSRNEPTSDDEFRSTAVAVVRFRASNGVEYEFDAPDAPRKDGTPLRVAYDPAMPSTARIVDRPSKHGCAAIVLALGLILLARGIFAVAPGVPGSQHGARRAESPSLQGDLTRS